jgi:hypothetical protein
VAKKPEIGKCDDCWKADATRSCEHCGGRALCDSCYRAHGPVFPPGKRAAGQVLDA